MINCVCLTQWPKRREMLSDALLSYQLQTHTDRRLVIVNDGMPLRSLRSDVHVLNLPGTPSIGTKRQHALVFSKGSWVATWDDDDFYLPHHLSSCAESIRNSGSFYVKSSQYFISDETLTLACVIPRSALGSSVFLASYALALGGYTNKSYGEDGELHLKFLTKGIPTSFCGELTYVYRRHTKNITNQYENELWSSEIQAKQMVEDQKRWPDPHITAWQNHLDQCLRMPRETLVEPM